MMPLVQEKYFWKSEAIGHDGTKATRGRSFAPNTTFINIKEYIKEGRIRILNEPVSNSKGM